MKIITPTETEQSIKQLYASIRLNLVDNTPISILHISSDCTAIASGHDELVDIKILGIGSEQVATNFFKHNPPTPGEVENAIQTVEDEVMSLSKLLPTNSYLYTSDNTIRTISMQKSTSFDEVEVTLTRPEMEQIFGRLAAIISGRPASSDSLPTEITFASTLLILREIMFHLNFTYIKIVK
jgi:exopolyphosphatase/pppGpp-phosphohydrolase